MNSFKTWAAAICSAAIALAALEGLLPEKGAARAAKFAAALWFILAVLAPLTGLARKAPELSFDVVDFGLEASSRYSDELIIDETARLVEGELYSQLAAAGIAPLEIEVRVNIATDGGIYCDSVGISLAADDADKAALAGETALRVAGVAAEIRCE